MLPSYLVNVHLTLRHRIANFLLVHPPWLLSFGKSSDHQWTIIYFQDLGALPTWFQACLLPSPPSPGTQLSEDTTGP